MSSESYAKFDWYEATLEGLSFESDTGKKARLFARRLLQECTEDSRFEDEIKRNSWRIDDFEFRDEKGFNYYRNSYVCYTPQKVAFFRIMWSELSSLHLIASGKRSPIVCDVVRKLCPLHFVTRADSALDFEDVGAWDKLVNYAEKVRLNEAEHPTCLARE